MAKLPKHKQTKSQASSLSTLDKVKQRLKLPDQLELSDALSAVRRALDHNWLMEAEVLCRFILGNRPEQPDAWALRGEAALADKDPSSARVYFHEALRCLDELPLAQDTRRQRHVYWQAIAQANMRLNRRELAEKAHIESARFDVNAKVNANVSDISVLLNRAYPMILQNQLDLAEPLLKTVLELAPANAPAWQGWAVLQHKRGNHELALNAIDKAIELNPNDAGFWNNRGVLLKPLGMPRVKERIEAYQKAVAINPNFKEAYSNLADALTSGKFFNEANVALDKALGLDPDYVGAKINRVNLLKAQGHKQEAMLQIEAILEHSQHPEAFNLKGALLLEMGEAHKAVEALEASKAIDARNASVLNNLGNAYLSTARPAKAIESYRSAVILAPGMAEAQANLALALLTQIQHGAPRGEYLALAKNHLKIAQELDSSLPQLFIAEGILKSQHDNDREGAQAAYQMAMQLQPESVQALVGLAGLYADMGERQKARELLKRAAEIAPDDADVMTGYIFALNYDPQSSPEEIYEAAMSYGAHIQKRVGEPYVEWANAKDINKRLKIGFVSGDFRRHPVSYFTIGLFKHLPRNQVEVYAYHNHLAFDDMSASIKNAVDHWQVIADMDTQTVCDLIRADGIDILVDLSGHTGYSRLDVFAKKPAPVSVSWLGFGCTTGLTSVDYILATHELIPEDESVYYTENVLRLPVDGCWASFDVCEKIIPPNTQPCIGSGHVTFASFNNLIKINDGVIDVWSEILLKVKDSVLLLNYKQLLDEKVRINLIEKFRLRGVDHSRLRLECFSPRRNSLNAYSSVDIALDTFPYGGGTTTCEALYFGVPVVTLKGDRFAGRVSQEYLKLLPWKHRLVANTKVEYIEKAVALAEDHNSLQTMRLQQQELFGSTIGNHDAFALVFLKTMQTIYFNSTHF